jgi:prolyl-tRNA editing enzyme YbaK/EbsC (Cys-tRNA(Pro) deacylase)
MTALPAANARVAAALAASGAHDAAAGVRRLDESTHTAAAAAAALGVPVGALGVAEVRRADPETVRSASGFAIGGVAPVGHPAPLRTIVDAHLAKFPQLWAAAGTPDSIFPTRYDELLRITAGTALDVAAT